jgi:hypothetical protein
MLLRDGLNTLHLFVKNSYFTYYSKGTDISQIKLDKFITDSRWCKNTKIGEE